MICDSDGEMDTATDVFFSGSDPDANLEVNELEGTTMVGVITMRRRILPSG